jgi:ATP-dependent Lon protease
MIRCIYIFKKGINKNKKCNAICYLNYNMCKIHFNKNNEKTNKSDNINISINNDIPIQTNNTLINKDNLKSKYGSKILIEPNTLKYQILNLETSDENKLVIFKHYENMKYTDKSSTEYYKNKMFVDYSLKYPWNKSYNIKNIIKDNDVPQFIKILRQNLDSKIYGMNNVKNEIINVMCKFITNSNNTRNNIALYGPAGVGKSKFIKVLSETLGLPMKTISLGGVKDSNFFLGNGYVYVESGPGKILQNIIDSKISNPILYFDELDKVSQSDHGKDIYSFLCYLTDPTQNSTFTDHYFYGMQFDLSKIFYVFTFNDIDKIDKILLDRLNVIKIDAPCEKDTIQIIEKYCIPEIITNIGIQKEIIFEVSNIKYIINYHKNIIDKNITSGIREYYRTIEKIFLELNKLILLNPSNFTNPVIINPQFFMQLFETIKQQLYIQDNSMLNLYPHMYI